MSCFHLEYETGEIIREEREIIDKKIIVKKYIKCDKCFQYSFRVYEYNTISQAIHKHFQCIKFVNF